MSIFTKTPVSQPILKLVPRATVIDPPTEEYRKLAKKLGIAVVAETVTTTLDEVLRAEGIDIYAMADVSAYMEKVTPKGRIYVWKACRQLDKQRSERHITLDGSSSHHGQFSDGVYSRPIPYPVLLTIDRIEEVTKKYRIQPAFFVSDYAVPAPDPFLMVTIPAEGMSQEKEPNGKLWTANPEPACFVIERWDEPSFREK